MGSTLGAWWTPPSGFVKSLSSQQINNVQFGNLIAMLNVKSQQVIAQLSQLQAQGSAMSIGAMFALQMAMNQLNQFSDTSTGVVGAANNAISTINRNLKQ